jgi:hypothetical protein
MLDKVSNTTNIDNSRYFLNTPRCVNKNSSSFTHSYLEHEDLTPKQKAVILGSSALGMALPLAFFSKRAGFSLNPLKILKTPIKDWAIFKYKPVDKVLAYGAAPIISMATGSVAGGFAGGALVDKDNLKAKKREVLSQLLGDVIVPITCVWVGAKTFKHFEKILQNIMPKFKDETKSIKKVLNTISENIPNAIATLGSLGVGIIAGNKVSNEINEKLYNMKVERGIKATDFAPHVDDLCMSISMVNEGSTFGSLLGRVIPLALLVPGYETGTAREK